MDTRNTRIFVINLLIAFLASSLFPFGCANPVAHIPEFNKNDLAGVTPASGAMPAPSGRSHYVLVPYDAINITFPYHPEHNTDSKAPITIRPDGNIILDAVGSIRAAGLTPEELGKIIAQKSSDRMKDPEVIVTIAQFAPRRIFVGGQVRTPGIVLISEGIIMTPLQAIFDRGGFTDTAQVDSVVLIRDAGSGNPRIGRLNVDQSMEGGLAEQVTLLPNDVLYVPMSGIGRADLWVRQHLRDILPTELFGLGGFIAGAS
ncbi:MAG: polysaccharide export protein [Deltaproteobacteria bacterium]|nr:MAG: polysaccharide export protein [Deltaproteobacteria bacterium]